MRFLCDVHISIQLCKLLSEVGHDCGRYLSISGVPHGHEAAVVVVDHGVWVSG